MFCYLVAAIKRVVINDVHTTYKKDILSFNFLQRLLLSILNSNFELKEYSEFAQMKNDLINQLTGVDESGYNSQNDLIDLNNFQINEHHLNDIKIGEPHQNNMLNGNIIDNNSKNIKKLVPNR